MLGTASPCPTPDRRRGAGSPTRRQPGDPTQPLGEFRSGGGGFGVDERLREPHQQRRDTAAQHRILAETFTGQGWEAPRLLAELPDAADFYFDAMAQLSRRVRR
ncbi:hypothetical protein ACFXG4_26540 [Nocardia sp. NPDC059246]|uniref:hypothetical protein n=1 Tax=unclassified Nocardia TaxID=2637762 RepID=UPI0036A830FF